AMRDLEIRGAGNLLGSEQSGHITAVGFELYCQLLKRSIAAQKGEKVKPRVEVTVKLDFLETHGTDAQAPEGRVQQVPGSISDRALSNSALRNSATLPHNYITEPHHRIEIYRKLAQAEDKAALESLKRELRDRFGPLPAAVELLLLATELKILASERNVTVIETDDDKLKLTRHGDFIQLGGKFPRLTKKDPKARLNEIKKLLLAL
ncbi:MAG: transcription-repair coupling factor, partial [Verrucomicrobia bacterium]|nr:transcription-repair coupling factor [Verrucomicrobiota bacterium]